MTNEPEALSERDEIEALLPWYVMGTLDLNSARAGRALCESASGDPSPSRVCASGE